MKWIRLWPDFIVNGTTFAELDAAQRGVWFSLLVLAGYSPKPGVICIMEGVPYSDEQLAAILRIPLDQLSKALECLMSPVVHKVKRLESGSLAIENWNRYQTEYDRQRGYRRGLHGRVTKKGYSEGLQRDTDTDTDTDTRSKKRKDLEYGETEVVGQPATRILEFQTDGHPSSWWLTKEQVAAWREVFPSLEVYGQCVRAKAWLDANEKRRKTAGGMMKFLYGWLARAQDGGKR